MRRIEVLFGELEQLCGQRNAIDGRIVEIVAELDRDELCGNTGARSMKALVAWKTGVSPRNAETTVAIARRIDEFPRCTQALRDGRLSLDQVGVIAEKAADGSDAHYAQLAGVSETTVAIARRIDEFPRCTQALREGRLSLDQVGVIAEKAADGSDAHYAQLASVATVNQLRTAVKLEPRPDSTPQPEPPRSFTRTETDDYTIYTIRLPRLEAAKFDAGLRSHHDGLVADWKHHHDAGAEGPDGQAPPFPNNVDAFMSLIEAGWDAEAARRPHGQHTTVIVHLNLDTDTPVASLHLGPLLTDEERQYLLCEATFEAWFQRHGQPLGAARTTRQISRRLRRALEHRDHCCVVPGCGATRGLHAHHLVHWENGGPTELHNLVLVCPYHHRLHHHGGITLTGPADHLVVTDPAGKPLHNGSLAQPPTTPPPDVPPCRGPTGERADWWWYPPFEPQPTPPSTN
ncbi:HNH endonuclease signature motif containing protein [Mycobacterium sp. URHD0025]|uniref:HNH endonuclease signature motif containing protein n=1 Tax=Mycobacterium sp. URHD0025 TaxID=1298864 RepID=UPI0003F61E9C|nr:HNH endonuclease signature motif containing protein [Mycobacterium sp. URHD0025]